MMKYLQYAKEFVVGTIVVGVIALGLGGITLLTAAPYFWVVPTTAAIVIIAFLLRLVGSVTLAEWELRKLTKKMRG